MHGKAIGRGKKIEFNSKHTTNTCISNRNERGTQKKNEFGFFRHVFSSFVLNELCGMFDIRRPSLCVERAKE